MNKLSTQPYKGVRDFYPDDMAVQRYIFDVWSQTAESFGFERYDASVLEPSEIYKSKGAVNEEMVNDQTYTFTDRGDREVTLRPEMTPTVARMIAGKAKELAFPVRWFSIPNLFRYERQQKGRLREHWQLNCDIFGTDDYTADVEIIALGYQILLNFGADPEMFEIRINDRREMTAIYESLGVTDSDKQTVITRLNDRYRKISEADYKSELQEIVSDESLVSTIYNLIDGQSDGVNNQVVAGLQSLGIKNVVIDRSLARGFDYYTGTVFEIFDVSGENNRSMLGGGRYDNLTEMFGGETVSGIGFGMGDVTMRDFLETHNLLTAHLTSPQLLIAPVTSQQNLTAQKAAQAFRAGGLSVSVDLSERKISKKISAANEQFIEYVLILGEDEEQSGTYTIKNLPEGTEISGDAASLIDKLTLN